MGTFPIQKQSTQDLRAHLCGKTQMPEGLHRKLRHLEVAISGALFFPHGQIVHLFNRQQVSERLPLEYSVGKKHEETVLSP